MQKRKIFSDTVRVNLMLVGCIVLAGTTVAWGIRPWRECELADQLASSIATILIVQAGPICWSRRWRLLDPGLQVVGLLVPLISLIVQLLNLH
jgi:hypothetical protein